MVSGLVSCVLGLVEKIPNVIQAKLQAGPVTLAMMQISERSASVSLKVSLKSGIPALSYLAVNTNFELVSGSTASGDK